MAKITITDILKAIENAASDRKIIEEKITDLNAKKDGLLKQLVTAEDAETYMAIRKQIDPVDAEIFVLNRKLERLERPYTDAEVQESWKDYAAGYNKRIQSALSDYLKDRSALAKKYRLLCEAQNEALQFRKKCGDLMGIESPAYGFPGQADNCYRSLIPALATLPQEGNITHANIRDRGTVAAGISDDAIFFAAMGEIDLNAEGPVLRSHCPKE